MLGSVHVTSLYGYEIGLAGSQFFQFLLITCPHQMSTIQADTRPAYHYANRLSKEPCTTLYEEREHRFSVRVDRDFGAWRDVRATAQRTTHDFLAHCCLQRKTRHPKLRRSIAAQQLGSGAVVGWARGICFKTTWLARVA